MDLETRQLELARDALGQRLDPLEKLGLAVEGAVLVGVARVGGEITIPDRGVSGRDRVEQLLSLPA